MAFNTSFSFGPLHFCSCWDADFAQELRGRVSGIKSNYVVKRNSIFTQLLKLI